MELFQKKSKGNELQIHADTIDKNGKTFYMIEWRNWPDPKDFTWEYEKEDSCIYSEYRKVKNKFPKKTETIHTPDGYVSFVLNVCNKVYELMHLSPTHIYTSIYKLIDIFQYFVYF